MHAKVLIDFQAPLVIKKDPSGTSGPDPVMALYLVPSLSVSLSLWLSVSLCLFPSVSLCLSLSVCLSVCERKGWCRAIKLQLN